jgi:hypothetical protein
MLVLTGTCVAAVLLAVGARIATAVPGPASDRARPAVVALSAAVTAGLVVFTLEGPLQRGWARRAGTPTSLLGSASGRGVTVSTNRPSAASGRPKPFSATIAGTISQAAAPGGEVVDLALGFTGGARGELRVRLAGTPAGSGLSLTGSQVNLTAVGLRSAMAGRVVSLQGQQFDASVRDRSGSKLLLHVVLNIDNQAGTVSGSLVATRAGAG